MHHWGRSSRRSGWLRILANSNLRIAVIEKNLAEQDRIVGELLQPGGVLKLKEMGLEHLLEGFDAQQIEGYGLFMNGSNFKISYPSENGEVIKGRGFRKWKVCAEKILAHIAQLPNVTLIEGAAEESLIETENVITGVKFISKEEKEEGIVNARLTIVCDGMFSVFREGLSKSEN